MKIIRSLIIPAENPVFNLLKTELYEKKNLNNPDVNYPCLRLQSSKVIILGLQVIKALEI